MASGSRKANCYITLRDLKRLLFPKTESTRARLLLGLVFLIATTLACNVTEDEVEQAELDIADAPIEIRVTAS